MSILRASGKSIPTGHTVFYTLRVDALRAIRYDEIMKTIPYGKVITVGVIREYLAKKNNADFQFVGLGTIYKYTLAGMDEDKLFREVP